MSILAQYVVKKALSKDNLVVTTTKLIHFGWEKYKLPKEKFLIYKALDALDRKGEVYYCFLKTKMGAKNSYILAKRYRKETNLINQLIDLLKGEINRNYKTGGLK